MAPTHGSSHNASAPRERKVVLGLENFAHRKGVTRAWQDFRDRKDKKKIQTARALRSYHKTMKQEGYAPGQGASRKRRVDQDNNNHNNSSSTVEATERQNDNENDKETVDNTHQNSVEKQGKDEVSRNNKRQKRTHRFTKAMYEAEERQKQKEQTQVDHVQNEKDRKKKLRERRQRTRKLMQRTQRGQPVMKNLVHDILDKLERKKASNEG